MQTIKLEATGFEIEVPDNFHYYDDGVVNSIAKHRFELYKRYGKKPKYNFNQRSKELIASRPLIGKTFKLIGKSFSLDVGGCTYVYPNKYDSVWDATKANAKVNYHIYTLRTNEEVNLINTKGHEETHVVLNNDKDDVLIERLEDFKIGTANFYELSEEVKCDLGGLCAMLRKFPQTTKGGFSIKPNIPTRDEFCNYLRKNTSWRIN